MKARFDPQAGNGKRTPLHPQLLMNHAAPGAKIQSYLQKQLIFSQGDAAAALFHIREGRIKLTIFSSEGKAATIAILERGDFLGEECLVPGR